MCTAAEGEINILQGRTRLLLATVKADAHLWPLALRHAAEQRFRDQFGVCLPRLIPLSQGMARFKRWHHVKDKDVWQHPLQKVTIIGPAHDMSPTSGWLLRKMHWTMDVSLGPTRQPEPAAGQTFVQLYWPLTRTRLMNLPWPQTIRNPTLMF